MEYQSTYNIEQPAHAARSLFFNVAGTRQKGKVRYGSEIAFRFLFPFQQLAPVLSDWLIHS